MAQLRCILKVKDLFPDIRAYSHLLSVVPVEPLVPVVVQKCRHNIESCFIDKAVSGLTTGGFVSGVIDVLHHKHKFVVDASRLVYWLGKWVNVSRSLKRWHQVS